MYVKTVVRIAVLVLALLLLPLPARGLDTAVTVVYRGSLLRTAAREETAAQLLERLGLEITEEDSLSCAADEPIRGGMTIRVDRVVTRVETYTTAVPHGSTACDDPSMPEGTWEVLVPGREGELRTTAEVTYVNGRETGRKVLQEYQTVAPVTEVVAWGTGTVPPLPEPDDLPVIEDGYIYLPTGEVLTYTGTGTVRASAYTHTDEGCDLITSTGSRVHVGTVAVDPRYIPYGTRMFIMATSGSYVYGISEAEDCGGAIKGDRVDLYLPTYEECMEFGRRVCTVYYLG